MRWLPQFNLVTVPYRYPIPHSTHARLHDLPPWQKLIFSYRLTSGLPPNTCRSGKCALDSHLHSFRTVRIPSHDIWIAQCVAILPAIHQFCTGWFRVRIQKHLETALSRPNEYELQVTLEKCKFGVAELVFLGHLITPNGFKPNPEKDKAIQECFLPHTIQELCRFLGFVNSYRRLLVNAADTQRPLNEFLNWSWIEV